MKKNYYGIINVLLVIILGLTVYNAFKPNKLGEVYRQRFDIIEQSLEKINKNMDEITTSTENSKWNKLKEISNAETGQEEAYNMLVADIKTCYLLEEDLDDEKTDNLKILDFKNKRKASNKQVEELFINNECLKNFEKYNTFEFSKDKNLNERLQKQIALITTTDNNADYNEEEFRDALIRESNIIHNIANLSSWLKIEYDTYK